MVRSTTLFLNFLFFLSENFPVERRKENQVDPNGILTSGFINSLPTELHVRNHIMAISFAVNMHVTQV